MPDAVFVDASAWVAIYWPRDRHHPAAASLRPLLVAEDSALMTTNWTLYEAASFLNRRRHDLAMRLLQWSFQECEVVKADELEEEALLIFESHADKTWSVVDCANFAAIRRHHCPYAFAFDDHFRQAQAEFGFKVLE